MKNLSNEVLLLHFDEEKICEYSNGYKEEGGVYLKGAFCPYWGGVCYGQSEEFFSGGLRDISVALLADQHSNGVIEVYEEDEECIRSKSFEG